VAESYVSFLEATPMSAPRARTRIEAPVLTAEVATGPDAPAIVSCPGCKIPLDLHQPDNLDPSRLLGICERCRSWQVIDLDLDRGQAILVLVPGRESLRRVAS
jgi:hypothetical protein